mgnify:CR=1 FL=1
MLYQINDGTVSLGGNVILDHIDFEIRGTEKVAVTGANGAGKTTLLQVLSGELELDGDDKRMGPGITMSRRLTVGMLKQGVFTGDDRTVEEELLAACPCKDTFARERFEYEQEYDRLFTGFGLKREDKKRLLSSFSGGEKTKIALIRLLLEKPDILILDEPTNHLDIETTEWLEQYLKQYEKAVVMVSHDRFFLDRTAEVVYELEDGHLTRYPGNYTHYKEEKRKNLQIQKKAYEKQQEEIRHLEELIEKFKHKPTKASFARSRKKILERMPKVPKPSDHEEHIFTGELTPAMLGSKWVFESEHLKIGYDRPIMEITMRIKRGQKIGILGKNGVGKTTFLKTAAGFLPPFSGEYQIGNQVTIGYFDQNSAQILSEKTVLEHFHELFPSMTAKDVRQTLGAYLFGGKDAAKKVSSLSGGEKSRLVLAELLQSRPNFLILDEPTNHMDVAAKETLESAFRAYTGTILFVSHDRYFIRQVAQSVLIFEDGGPMYYPFGYEHYLEKKQKADEYGEELSAQVKAEDAALLAGMRAVPKAERHRLKEFSVEEAYADWKLRLVQEKLEPEELEYGRLEEEYQGLLDEWKMSEAYWMTEPAARMTEKTEAESSGEKTAGGTAGIPDEPSGLQEDVAAAKARRDEAWECFHARCMEWYEVYEEVHGYSGVEI